MVPNRHSTHHGIYDGQKFAHAGYEGCFLNFASIKQTPVESRNDGITPCRYQCCHIQRGSKRGPTTPYRSFTAHGTAVTIEGRYPNQSSDLATIDGTQLG